MVECVKVTIDSDTTRVERIQTGVRITGPVANVSIIGLIFHKGFSRILASNTPPTQKEIKSFIFWKTMQKKTAEQYHDR